MKISKLIYVAAVAFALVHCGPAATESHSALTDSISQNDAESVCYSAGISNLPRASRYDATFNVSHNSPTYVGLNGIFSFNAPFAHGPSKIVDARAFYGSELMAEEGKNLNIRYTGGIANSRHILENFRFLLGYKIGGQDNWVEMNWVNSPTTTYTAYTLDFQVPAVNSDSFKLWFEGRYTENGVEKTIYDSNNGQNYSVNALENATKSLCFDSGWREAVKGGAPAAGDTLEIVYDVQRLTDRMLGTTYAAWPAWSAYMHFKITAADGTVASSGKLPLYAHAYDPANGASSTRRPGYKPLLKIPSSAKGGQLTAWFEGPNRGPTVWDSNYQQNYIIDIR